MILFTYKITLKIKISSRLTTLHLWFLFKTQCICFL